MGQPTDGDLWRRAVDGEPDAFGVLFERHGRAVYNYLFRRTADWALAEDLTSVVFLEAWRRRKDVRLEAELALPWLFGIATNVLRNSRRSQWRHRAALERLPREHAPTLPMKRRPARRRASDASSATSVREVAQAGAGRACPLRLGGA